VVIIVSEEHTAFIMFVEAFLSVSSFILTVEPIGSSETLVTTYQVEQCYSPNHLNLKRTIHINISIRKVNGIKSIFFILLF
jgi:hypothetical protein